MLKVRILNWLIALDQFLFCTICLGNSYPDETASSAAYRMEREGRWQGKLFRPMIDFLFFFQKNHCELAWKEELNRTQAPTSV